jgi:hypothetical protein
MKGKTPTRISSTHSEIAFRVEMVRAHQGELIPGGIGTAFLWRVREKIYVVTNHHNVTGWDHLRGKALSPSGIVPTHLKLILRWAEPAPIGWLSQEAPVLASLFDHAGEPLWLTHPKFGADVDVAVLGLGQVDAQKIFPDAPPGLILKTIPANDDHNWIDFDVAAGDDAFVMGYPKGLDGGDGFPLWKRASIASEPALDQQGLPKILVDTATRPGMSGSPVIVIRRGLITVPGGVDKIGAAASFLGIYSGRADDDPLGAQIGIVWKKQVIEEIVRGGTKGRSPWAQ